MGIATSISEDLEELEADSRDDGTGMRDATLADAENPFTGTSSTESEPETTSDNVDTDMWMGLAWNPTAAFIGGTDESGDANVQDVSSPADVGAALTGTSDEYADLPGVDPENEVVTTTTTVGGSAADAAGDLLREIPWRMVALVAAGIVGFVVFVNAFAGGLAEGVTNGG